MNKAYSQETIQNVIRLYGISIKWRISHEYFDAYRVYTGLYGIRRILFLSFNIRIDVLCEIQRGNAKPISLIVLFFYRHIPSYNRLNANKAAGKKVERGGF